MASKGAKSVAEIDFSTRSQEIAVYDKQTHIPVINEFAKKQFYKITTIEEDEESQNSTNYHKLGLGVQKGTKRYGDINTDLQITDSKKLSQVDQNKEKQRGVSMKKHQIQDPIDEYPEKNLFDEKKKSVPSTDKKAETDEDQNKYSKK